MGLFDLFRREPAPEATGQVRPASAVGHYFASFDDPAFLEYIRSGQMGGARVTTEQALANSSVSRAVKLISGAIGMLPLNVMQKTAGGKVEKAERHPLYKLLRHKPNNWQTPFEFKRLLQTHALVEGNAYAHIVTSGSRVIQLNPLNPKNVTPEQQSDWSIVYKVTRPDGSHVTLPAREVLHIRDLTLDGITGLSTVRQAAETISLAIHSNRAAERIFRNGMMVGGALKHPGKLSPEALEHLRASMEARFAGSENAGRWMVLEEGMEATPFSNTAAESQLNETRGALVEEISRHFGVPRPLMNVDDTSWGSGIEQLAILFVRFGLAPWFTAWEDAIARSCIPEAEWGSIYADFDETELLRGSSKDQAEFFAKALGSGGHKPWMEANEVRESVGLGKHQDGGGLVQMGKEQPAAAAGGISDVSAPTP